MKTFEIFEKKQNGRYGGLDDLYPKMPIIKVSKTTFVFNSFAEDALKLEAGSEILVAKNYSIL